MPSGPILRSRPVPATHVIARQIAHLPEEGLQIANLDFALHDPIQDTIGDN